MNRSTVALFVVLIFVSACGEAVEPPPRNPHVIGTACVPGLQVACGCPGASESVQVCRDDGIGFGACECGGSIIDGGSATDGGMTDGSVASDDGAPITVDGARSDAIGLPPGSSLYKVCASDLDCDAGEACKGIGVSLQSSQTFCTTVGCDDAGGGRDPRCSVIDGVQGKCAYFGNSFGTVCLASCASNSDCGVNQACNIQSGLCFSSCTGDADCDTASGFACDGIRKLCVTA